MNRKRHNPSAQGWHIARWPALAWLETAIKLVAIAVGVAAFVTALSSGGALALPGGRRLVQLIVLALLALGLLAAIYDRWLEREIVAMAFVLVNNLGHWGMTLALTSDTLSSGYLVAFCALMLIGVVIKLVFLRVHAFQVRDIPRTVLFGLTSVYVVGYGVILLLELV